MKKVTIADVAHDANVSKSLVSNYLNEKYSTMSKEAREKIKNSIEKLDYTPNESYRNFRKNKTNNIGLIVPDITDMYYANICKGIFDAGFDKGYNVMMASTNKSIQRENEYLNSFMQKVDGIILSSVSADATYLNKIRKNTPVVLLEKKLKDENFDIVTSNNYDAVIELLNNLYMSGYEKLALFTEPLVKGTSRNVRCKAFEEFVQEKQLQDKAYIYEINLNDDINIMKHLIEFHNKNVDEKKAVIGVNGKVLLKLLSSINAMGLDEKDVIATGYDDFGEIPLNIGGLTLIKQPVYEMGYKCVQRVVERINTKEVIMPRAFKLKSKMLIST